MTRELSIWAITFGIVLGFTVAAWLAAKEGERWERKRSNRLHHNEIARIQR